MIGHYLKSAIRNLRKHTFFSFINIVSLAIGIAAFILILLYVRFEHSYDRFHTKADRICRVTRKYDNPNGYQRHFARTPETWINELPAEFPEIETLIRFQHTEDAGIRIGDHILRDDHWFTTDPEVFDVFDFQLTEGDASTALREPRSVVLSASMARKYFGEQNPIGEELQLIGWGPNQDTGYKITGIMKDTPSNSHFQVHFLCSWRTPQERQGWAYVYILLKPGFDLPALESKLPAFIEKHGGEESRRYSSMPLQKLTDIHLHSNIDRELEVNGDIRTVRLFSLISFFILLIAAFNFMNLSTARSLNRAREIGVRKVLGSSRRQLIRYFLSESLLYVLVALVLSLTLLEFILPWFGSMLGIQMSLNFFRDWNFLLLCLCGSILLGIFAGLYPALYLSSFRPAQVLGGKSFKVSSAGKSGSVLARRLLVILQFSISTGLIICTLINYRQFRFLQHKHLGFNTEQIVALRNIRPNLKIKYGAFRNAVLEKSEIIDFTGVMDEPSKPVLDAGSTVVEGSSDTENGTIVYILPCDENFIDFMNISQVAGHDFFPRNLSDPERMYFPNLDETVAAINQTEREYILNERALSVLGFNSAEEALGRQIEWGNALFHLQRGPIVGVVQDFHYSSLHDEIKPMLLIHEPFFIFTYLIKIRGSDARLALRQIEEAWKEVYPDQPFEYFFLDDMFEQLYRAEELQGKVMLLFSALAIFIAYLGLFGLTAFSTEQRKKEIGIRKVLGASIPNLAKILTKEIFISVILSVLIASPLAWLIMERWLQNFAYHTGIAWWIFPLAGCLALAIAAVTTGFQVFRAASSNPVESLKYE